MSRICLVLLLAVTLRTHAQWPSYPIADAPAHMHEAVQRADLVIVSLQGAVLSELTRELQLGGALGAIKSCHLDANSAASRAARKAGIAAGRTSDRLRNPANAPKPWAAPIVERYAGRPAAGVDGFVVDLGDRVGVMRPITQRHLCGACHGPTAGLDAGVRAELRARYPADRAVGFNEGELRGWFWVEVPKK
jgi:hypothetical protein